MAAGSRSLVVEILRLKPSEYDQLLAVEEGFRPDPEHSIVVVAKHAEKIVGRSMLIRPWHIEGTWVEESFRKGTIGLRIVQRLEFEAEKQGIQKILSFAQDHQIEDYLFRLDYRPVQVSVWEKKCL